MKTVIVSLYDRATEGFGPATTVKTRAAAIRSFANEVNEPGTPINRNPSDYELWQVAEFDEQTGTVTPAKDKLARGEDLKKGA